MNKTLKYVLMPVVLAPAVYLTIIWNSIPETMAMHFKLDGTPDRVGNRTELITSVLILLALSIGVYFLVSNIYKIDRKKNAVENKDRLHRMAFALSVFISLISIMVIYTSSSGHMRFDVKLIFGVIGFMWCILGNYMYTMKPNSFAGIRNRWTLNNEKNWKKTHHFAGKLWFITGLLLAAICLLTPQDIAVIAFLIVSFSVGFLPIIYSYYLYKKQKNQP